MKKLVMALIIGISGSGLLFLASSCGDDGGNTNGVNNDKKLSDLSEQEAYDLCVGFCEEAQVPMQEGICTATAVSLSLGNATACEKLRDQCMAKEVDCAEQCSMDDTSTDEGEDDTEEVEECDATVGEMAACYEAFTAMVNDVLGQITCETSLSELQSVAASLEETPEACEVIEEKCPGAAPSANTSEM